MISCGKQIYIIANLLNLLISLSLKITVSMFFVVNVYFLEKITLEDCIDEIYSLATFLARQSPFSDIFGKKISFFFFRFRICIVITKEVSRNLLEHPDKGIAPFTTMSVITETI